MRNHSGFLLLEVIISLLLIAIFFSSMTYLQFHFLSRSAQLINESIAKAQIDYLVNRLQHIEDDTESELYIWNEMNYKILPNGKGDYTHLNNKKVIKVAFANGNLNVCKKNCVQIIL